MRVVSGTGLLNLVDALATISTTFVPASNHCICVSD
jgi:hypothetical protein